MALITLQLGQCGNQIGFELFDVICNDFHSNGLCSRKENDYYQTISKERFFEESESGEFVSRAVLLDMEPKVISQTLAMAARSGKWTYDDKSQFSQKQGSGNNWSHGFCVHGPKYQDLIMDLVRKQVEKCDRLGGFFNIMSMAGGTGSGMGTFITKCLRDIYPNSLILNELVWPYGTGEVIVQNYNSILTLSHLYQTSDALLIHENDISHKICSQLMNIKNISFKDVNKVIAHQLGSVFQPTYTPQSSNYSRNPLGINWQVQPSSHPKTEKISLKTGLQFNKSLANLAIFRGKNVESASPDGFQDPALYTSWLSPGDAFTSWKTPRAFNKYEKSATLVSNSQCLLKPLDTIVEKAWNMFASKAYVHQYTKYGTDEEEFLQCFTTLEQVISSYSNL